MHLIRRLPARPLGPRAPLLTLSRGVAHASSAASREPADDGVFPTYKGPTQLLINNKWVNARDGGVFSVINPGNGQQLAQVQLAGPADVDAAVEAAHTALYAGPWGKEAPRTRGNLLFRLADLVEKHKEELAQLESLNNGKSLGLSRAVDVPATAAMLRYWAGWADKITGKVIPVGGDLFCHTRHEPVGVVAAIIPWNLPLIAVAAKLGPALTCGNTLLLKPAEQTPLTALRLAELALEAGFPPGVINVLPGDGPTTGSALVQHAKVDKVSFTGSVEVGKKIQEMASRTLKRVTLELGGKNPSIVFADADMELAIDQVHNGLFWNKAEACAAGTRIFVERKIYDEFLEKSVARAKARRVGHPFHPNTDDGALVSEEQMNKVLGYVKKGQEEGAQLICGGHRVGTKGFYVQPAVFTNIRDDMSIFRDEIFGPVMTMTPFSTVDEVIQRANATKYGLAAGVFTKDITKGYEVMSKIRSGMVFWNCYHAVDVAAPFGGMKESGFGREGGEYGLLPYLEVKNVVMRVK